MECNDSILALFGYLAEELKATALTLMDCFHPDSHAHLRASFALLLSNLRSHSAGGAAAAGLMPGGAPRLSSTAVYMIKRKDSGCVAAACRLSLILDGSTGQPTFFSLLIDGKQEFKS